MLIARHLNRAAGRGGIRELTPLSGGRNNQVYRIDHADGDASILKIYHRDPRDPRDRMAHEWAFLRHAQDRGVHNTPRPLARDDDRNAALFSYAPGRKLRADEVDAEWVDRALDFLVSVNAPGPADVVLPDASEACFSLGQHLATIERRLASVEQLMSDGESHSEARNFVAQRLLPAWNPVKAAILTGIERLGLDQTAALPLSDRVVSPSDFGFHNALVAGRNITFLDFEYAGLDDPAKLVCDFLCQPDRPPPPDLYAHVVRRLTDDLTLSEAFVARCRLLHDAYRIKWACILLNDFLPLGAARRAFAGRPFTAARAATQLERAGVMIDALSEPFEGASRGLS